MPKTVGEFSIAIEGLSNSQLKTHSLVTLSLELKIAFPDFSMAQKIRSNSGLRVS
jgi:hypothetical protein